jgi:glutaconate CoA-transferase subunit B
MEPDAVSREMTVTSMHPGVTRAALQANTGWPLKFSTQLAETPPPTVTELEVLRALQERTRRAHGG